MVFLAALGAPQGSSLESVVSIDVNTGEATPVEAGGGQQEAAWPEAPMDLSGVHVKLLEGEDPTGEYSPKELMIRSFLRLPLAEQERMGFTSLYQEGMALDDIDSDALKVLWEQRQEELKAAMEAMQEAADTLSSIIRQIRSGDEESVEAALADLEEHLSDVDMARDLHNALGGWPPLVRLLSSDQSPRIRAGAALVIGTAIKNEPVFQSWILESAAESVDVNPQQNETALSSLLGMLEEQGTGDVQVMHRRSMYALASALRHNLRNQAAFMELGGLERLQARLVKSCDGGLENPALVSKLAALVFDVLEEEKDQGYGWRKLPLVEELHHRLGSPEWALLVSECLSVPSHRRVQESLLRALDRQFQAPFTASERELLEGDSGLVRTLKSAQATYCTAPSEDFSDEDANPNEEACALANSCLTQLGWGAPSD